MAVPVPELLPQAQPQPEPIPSEESPALSPVSWSNDNSGTRFARGLLYAVPLSVVMWLVVALTVLSLST